MNVFTYGSLMFDEVWEAVVGRRAASVVGRLDGHAAWKVRGQVFPGMTPAEGHQVAGRVWQGVIAAELEKLDAFESGIYVRQLVSVRADDGPAIACWTYLVRPDCRGLLLNEAWDREEFRQRHLTTFLR